MAGPRVPWRPPTAHGPLVDPPPDTIGTPWTSRRCCRCPRRAWCCARSGRRTRPSSTRTATTRWWPVTRTGPSRSRSAPRVGSSRSRPMSTVSAPATGSNWAWSTLAPSSAMSRSGATARVPGPRWATPSARRTGARDMRPRPSEPSSTTCSGTGSSGSTPPSTPSTSARRDCSTDSASTTRAGRFGPRSCAGRGRTTTGTRSRRRRGLAGWRDHGTPRWPCDSSRSQRRTGPWSPVSPRTTHRSGSWPPWPARLPTPPIPRCMRARRWCRGCVPSRRTTRWPGS